MKFQRIGVRLAVAACVAAATVVLDTSTALALPSDCRVTDDYAGNSGSVQCFSGTGSVRVVVTCENPIVFTESQWFGVWVPVHHISKRTCPYNLVYLGADYELRD